MLGRSSGDAGARLRRSKSASAVTRHHAHAPEPLDPHVAQHHALAAATTAFVRAHGISASEKVNKRSSELSRTKSTSSRKSLTSQGSHFPPRESSNQPRDSQIPITQRQSRPTAINTEKFPPFYPTPGSDRPLSTQPSITFNENTRPCSQSRSHQQSATSSITSQQIRKARSMYYASSIQTGSPIARPPAQYLTTPPAASIRPAPDVLRVRNTAPSPLVPPKLPVTVAPGNTIDDARDKYLQTFQQQQRPIKHKPSLFLAPFKKRQERAKKKERPVSAGVLSAPSSSRHTPHDVSRESLDDFGFPIIKKEKRSFSNSIKDKFKKVFRRTSNNTTIMPVQQIEASRDYFNNQVPSNEVITRHDTPDIPSPDHKTLLRVKSRASSFERAPSPILRPSSRSSNRSRGSNRSLHSETNATHMSSRVTSWNESSAGNTLTQRDMKRLTVIHEAKDSIGSDAERSISSNSLRRKTVPFPSFSAFQDPMPMESLLEEASTPVDPKRVFSALMREIGSTKIRQTPLHAPSVSPGAKSDVFESSATKELRATTSRELDSSASKDPRTSMSSDGRLSIRRQTNKTKEKSMSLQSVGRAFKSTIRAVTPTERLQSSNSDRTASLRAIKRIPRPSTGSSSSSQHSDRNLDPNDDNVHGIDHSQNAEGDQHGSGFSPLKKPPTPVMFTFEDHVSHSNGLLETPSYKKQPPSHHRAHARTLSTSDVSRQSDPYTPITVVGIPHLAELEGDPPKQTTSRELRVATPQALSRSPQAGSALSPMSPSVYSRNTDGASIVPNDSVMSLDQSTDSRPHNESGCALITSHAVQSYSIGARSPRHINESTRSSRDWKAWLSHEISELGNSVEEDITFQGRFSPSMLNELQPNRHHREYAEIEEDNSTMITRDSVDFVTPSQVKSASTPFDKAVDRDKLDLVATPAEPSSPSENFSENLATFGEIKPCMNIPTPMNFTPTVRRSRLSSAFSSHSALSRSSNGTPKSSVMNDRFPFIHTGRRTSSNSARLSRSSRSPTDSSSSTRSKGTPGSKIYSNLAAPVHFKRKHENDLSTGSKETENISDSKIERRENTAPKPTHTNRPASLQPNAAPAMFSTTRIIRPRSMFPLTSASLNRSTKSLTQYTTTTERSAPSDAPSRQGSSPQRQTLGLGPPNLSPIKLTARPRSAIDLRGRGDTTRNFGNLNLRLGSSSVSPKKKRPDQKVPRTSDNTRIPLPARTAGFEQDTLRTIIESPRPTSECPRSLCSSLEAVERQCTTPRSLIKHSDSTLALHMEPSPGLEEKTIDAIIDDQSPSRHSVMASSESNCGDERPSMTGAVTPGQRMAERFLRERSIPRESGTISPCSIDNLRNGKSMACSSQKVKREDTPAFL